MANPDPSPETRFKPGESGNPGGRPKNREELGSRFTEDVLAVWKELGADSLRRLAKDKPEKFAEVAAEQIEKDPQKASIDHKHTVSHHVHQVSEASRDRVAQLLGDGQPGDPAPLLPH